ncbi:VOC family protein [Planosporangium thailandense]|uniref:VOC family protein n=1 Tax=Planosporangium thailandense TaxID=765197 RepID=A0ABX0Y2T9_9ACTN|nr:VOC family protein [Planosporangium thailandense]
MSAGDVAGGEPDVVDARPAAPAAVEPAGPVVPAGGLFIGNAEPPAEDANGRAGTAAPAGAGAGTAPPAGAAATPPDPYVAPYLADAPDDEPQGLDGVHNVGVTVIVSDLGRSLTFYRDLLGLTEIDGGQGSAILASGNARILLRQVADTPPVDRRVVHLNLEVDDVHEAYERLRRHGVEFMHPPRVVNKGEQLEQWAATLRDPDGHAIALTHWEDRV